MSQPKEYVCTHCLTEMTSNAEVRKCPDGQFCIAGEVITSVEQMVTEGCNDCGLDGCQRCCDHADTEHGFCIYCSANVRELRGENEADAREDR